MGANTFLRKHTSKAVDSAAPVKLALTTAALHVMPVIGREREELSCSLETIRSVEITMGSSKERGMSFIERDGRKASFIGKVDDTLATRLTEMGATLSLR